MTCSFCSMLSAVFTVRSSGRASPSTREAIAGMLSISRAFMPDHSSSKEEMASPRLRRKKIQFSDDYGENIDKVHQDEDYSKYVESYLNGRGVIQKTCSSVNWLYFETFMVKALSAVPETSVSCRLVCRCDSLAFTLM